MKIATFNVNGLNARLPALLRWLERFHRHATELLAENRPAVLAGDFNVIPTDFDVYAPERWRDDALFPREAERSRASLDRARGLVTRS